MLTLHYCRVCPPEQREPYTTEQAALDHVRLAHPGNLETEIRAAGLTGEQAHIARPRKRPTRKAARS